MRQVRWAVGLMVLLLAACAQMGVVTPQGLDQQLAYAQAAVTAARTSAANAVTSGQIGSADAQKALDLTDSATAAIQAARSAESTGDTTTAVQKLQVANQVLVQLQAYLASKGVK